MDGRTWEAKLLGKVMADLTAHCGGKPSATQRALIDRAAWLTLYVAKIDRRTAEGGTMTEHDSRTYLAWSNALARTLAKIGLKGADHEEVMSPLDYMAQRAERAA
jgi:hypothetical protein